jgi:hypothetical protein
MSSNTHILLSCSEGLRLDGNNTTDLPSDLRTVRLCVAYKERIIYAELLGAERKTFCLHSDRLCRSLCSAQRTDKQYSLCNVPV